MTDINTILKLNGLNCLLFGSLFVFIPDSIIPFLSLDNPIPKWVLLSLGVGLNLYGLYLLWLGAKHKVPHRYVLFVAFGDFMWVLATVVLIVMKTWITTINGMTAAGLVAILVGWFGWLQLQYFFKESKQP